MENLTKTNRTLTTELADTNAKLITTLLRVTKLIEQLDNTKGGKGKITFDTGTKMYYYHSHDYACLHHSGNCPSPKDGHNRHAMSDNKLGGHATKYKAE